MTGGPASRNQYPLTIPRAAVKGIPSEFRIGSTTGPSLVSASSVIAHLRLLGAFHVLEHTVSAHKEKDGSTDISNPPGAVRWRVFIHQAVWRFEIWLKRVIIPRGIDGGALKDEEIPPSDVLLVWHAYLLNPRVYADDTKRAYPELGALCGLPLERIATHINPSTLRFEPTAVQMEFWKRMTLAPPEPLLLSLSSHEGLVVECQRCAGPPVQVPWLCEPILSSNGHAKGTGWCQNDFNAQCGSCGFRITRESIAVGRFAADIVAALENDKAVLPGTLFDPRTCMLNTDTAQHITTVLLQPFVDMAPTQQAIGEHLAWTFSGLESSVIQARDTLMEAVHANNPHRKQEIPSKIGLPTREGTHQLSSRILKAQAAVGCIVHDIWMLKEVWKSYGPRIAKMLSSYKDNPTPFSTDLAGAHSNLVGLIPRILSRPSHNLLSVITNFYTSGVNGDRFSTITKIAKRVTSRPNLSTYPSEHPNTVVLRDSKIATDRWYRERERTRTMDKSFKTNGIPFVRSIKGPEDMVKGSTAGVVAFGSLGLDGWALLGDVDQCVLDAETIEKGQCCAGYGRPYFGGPGWFGTTFVPVGGCTTGGCSAGPCSAQKWAGACLGGGSGHGGGGGGGCGGGGD